jgi:hypothetical protein
MANTYILINSSVLSSTTSTVTFSSIPSTYTDLVLKASARSTLSGTTYYQMKLTFDNSGSVYSATSMYSYSGTIATQTGVSSGASEQGRGSINGNGLTASTFGITEFYIPNYAGSTNKPLSSIGFAETNDTIYNSIVNLAYLYRDTNAISSIAISGTTFAIGSSFYLYGIKKS